MIFLPRYTPDLWNERMPGPPLPLDLTLHGRCIALTGPCGIGKSTLLRHLEGQAAPGELVVLDDATPSAAAELATAHPAARIFITAAEGDFPGFAVHSILPFDGADVYAFLRQWHMLHPFPVPVEAVETAILSHPDLSELSGTPAILAEMAAMWHRGTPLPEHLPALFTWIAMNLACRA